MALATAAQREPLAGEGDEEDGKDIMKRNLIITFTAVAIVGSLLWLWKSAYRTPLDAGDFAWEISGGGYIAVGTYGVAWATDTSSGSQYTKLYIWPPRVHRSFISNEAARLLMDDRIWESEPDFDPLWKFQYESVRARDDRGNWSWPDYWR